MVYHPMHIRDYPNFYTNLYTLLQPSIFHVKYMSRFFKLLNVFLSSSHLPLYLVAAFAKRLSHLALTAPPQGVMIAGVMVTNLIKRHPNCRVLLNRSTSECNTFLAF
jgi:U3 small nucleolar RNA-associated protein 19